MKKSPILEAIDQICEEKHIPRESVLSTIEAALAVAYRKDFADKKNQNIQATFNPEDASARIFDVKEVVEDELFAEYEKQREEAERLKAEMEANPEAAKAAEEAQKQAAAGEGAANIPDAPPTEEEEKKRRFDPKSMIPLAEVLKTKPDAKIGDIIKTELFPPEEYGRMAAQTAKQVIIQRLREAERETVFGEFKERVGEILTGTVQRVEGRVVLVDMGHATAVMPPSEQIERERYMPGQRVKVYVVSVNQTTRGPEILVSRTHSDMVRKLFTQEVPEVASGAITLKGVAREAGSRTKVAVYTTEPNIDPVGSCVGQRGTRVQTVIAELGGEKIDIIQYEEDPVRFIISALSPAKVLSVQLKEEEHRAIAEVREDQLSFAIGRGGQNVRLAARLTGWKIDIVKENTEEVAGTAEAEAGEKPAAEGVSDAVDTAEAASSSKEQEEKVAATGTEQPKEVAEKAEPVETAEQGEKEAGKTAEQAPDEESDATAEKTPEQKHTQPR